MDLNSTNLDKEKKSSEGDRNVDQKSLFTMESTLHLIEKKK